MGKVVKGIGKILGKVAPIAAGFIPGIGPLAAAAIGAGSQVLTKGGKVRLGDLVSGGLAGGAGGVAAGKLGGLKGLAANIAKNPLQAAQVGSGILSTIQGAHRTSRGDDLLAQAMNNRVPLALFNGPYDPSAVPPGVTGGTPMPNRAKLAALEALGYRG
jgi:hypothetical protein